MLLAVFFMLQACTCTITIIFRFLTGWAKFSLIGQIITTYI